MKNNNTTMQQFSNLLIQLLPLFLTIIVFFTLSFLLLGFIHILNLFPITDKIRPELRIADVLVGLTIYIKTSVDFALFIGNLMSKNLGIKKRIAIEIGTAAGNAVGTLFILLVWTFFKEVPLLMIAMIFLASLVLLQMAEEGLDEFILYDLRFRIFKNSLHYLRSYLHVINSLSKPVVQFILPITNAKPFSKKTFLSLLLFSFTIPLVLGLDDFAGYIPLFTIINVFGFAIGVFAGHTLLNVALFASPNTTIRVVKQPFVALMGSLAFIGIAVWGFVEIVRIILP